MISPVGQHWQTTGSAVAHEVVGEQFVPHRSLKTRCGTAIKAVRSVRVDGDPHTMCANCTKAAARDLLPGC